MGEQRLYYRDSPSQYSNKSSLIAQETPRVAEKPYVVQETLLRVWPLPPHTLSSWKLPIKGLGSEQIVSFRHYPVSCCLSRLCCHHCYHHTEYNVTHHASRHVLSYDSVAHRIGSCRDTPHAICNSSYVIYVSIIPHLGLINAPPLICFCSSKRPFSLFIYYQTGQTYIKLWPRLY